jgi:hypothetical protein
MESEIRILDIKEKSKKGIQKKKYQKGETMYFL